MTHHTPQGLPPADREDGEGLEPCYSAELVEQIVSEAIAAQAASVEPVASVLYLSDTGLCSEISEELPWGMALYAGAPPAPASVQNASLVEKLAKRTCEANADSARFTIALQTLRASLDPDDWMGAVTMHNYIDAVLAGGSPLQQHPAPSPVQAVIQVGCENIDGTLNIHPETETCSISGPAAAVDAVPYATLQEVDRFFSGRLAELGSLSGEATDLHAYVRAVLQASCQPQAQQAVAEGAGGGLRQTLIDAGRAIAWQCFGDCRAYDEFGPGSLRGLHEMDAEIRAALATKEPK